MHGGNQIFFTQIFTRSGVFFTVKLSECQCKNYTKISPFSHNKSRNSHNMDYFQNTEYRSDMVYKALLAYIPLNTYAQNNTYVLTD